MASIAELMSLVRPYAPECPDPIAEQALAEAAREWCQQTWTWQAAVDGEVEAGATSLTFYELPTDTTLVSVLTLRSDTKRLTPRTTRQLSREDAQWRSRSGPHQHYIFTGEKNTIELYPFAVPALTYSGTVAVAPVRGGDELGDRVADEYGEIISYGALARLLRIPRREWTDIREAAQCEVRFLAAMPLAKSRAVAQFESGVVRTTGYGGI